MKTMMRGIVSASTEVIDFERTNRVPQIENLLECTGEIISGMKNIWYEYVPKSYHDQKVPLIVQIHGGGHDGKRWANLTIWHELADREGMIILYPNSPEYEFWSCEDTDIQYLYDLIQFICKKYKIDKNRIYMQGMSNGDMMVLAFSMRYPNLLAAAGYITGPSAKEILDGDKPTEPVPIIQMRGELDVNWKLTPETIDVYENRYEINDLNREIWEEVNGTTGLIPMVSIEGKDNYLYYKGTKAVIINWEVQGMGHREPVYSAEILWNKLYRYCKREDGKVKIDSMVTEKKAQEDIVLICAGSNQAYHNGKIIPISDFSFGTTKVVLPADVPHFCNIKLDEMCETEVMCVPAELLERVYDAVLEYKNAKDILTITFPDGKTVKLIADSMLLNIDGTYMAMQKPCFLRCGIFYIPAEEFCKIVLHKQISIADDMMCISDHYTVLGKYTARVMRKYLGGTIRTRK